MCIRDSFHHVRPTEGSFALCLVPCPCPFWKLMLQSLSGGSSVEDETWGTWPKFWVNDNWVQQQDSSFARGYREGGKVIIFIGPESDHWECLSVTDWLTDSLTHCRLVNLIDVTLAGEDGNSKLVEVVTVVEVDDEKQFGADLGGELWS